MDKRWVIKEKGDQVVVRQLAGALGVSESLANLMAQRSITSPAEAKAFFNPSLDYLHDPFLMKDMNLAVDRITTAINKNERILVYGDYDVDGTTAVAMMYSFLKEQYSNVDYYIPDRYKEGYGVSFQGLDYAGEHNCKVVITLDCGIKAVEKVKYARTKGLDVIICDHHYPGDEIPKAIAVLDLVQLSLQGVVGMRCRVQAHPGLCKNSCYSLQRNLSLSRSCCSEYSLRYCSHYGRKQGNGLFWPEAA
jgi:single-stranded-DNA-specific exonuclease